ncbi:MAG: cyclic nucleotide-binding domain-containing protein [Candidatus Riflebacteria bacterium]|nr:cyclic nucleotide-binding domain-containing protein [Candidatus Riflebacteria bacterium]
MNNAAIYDILLFSADRGLAEAITEARPDSYLVRIADTRTQLEAALANFSLDLLLFHAPDGAELDLLCEIGERAKLPPTILISRYTALQERPRNDRLMALGLSSFIPWPLETTELAERLDSNFARNPKPFGDLQHKRLYRQGEPIFLENEVGHECYTIVSGRVRICRVIESRTLYEVGMLGPGEVFGEMALLRSTRRSGMALAVDDVIVTVTTRETFRHVVETNSGFVQNLMRVLSRRILDLESRLYGSLPPRAPVADHVPRGTERKGGRRRFSPGEVLFSPQERATRFYLVEKGQVGLTPIGGTSGQGPAEIAPGQLLGEVEHLLDRPYEATATALVETICVPLDGRALANGNQAEPALCLKLAQGLAAKLDALLDGMSARQMHEVF